MEREDSDDAGDDPVAVAALDPGRESDSPPAIAIAIDVDGEVCERRPVRRSGLVIEIPEAEPAVAEPRSRLDGVAALGVPPHVTALFPFLTPDAINEVILRHVSEVAAANDPFDYRFARTGWFGQHTLYLAPDRPEPFRALTESLWAAFPECPPYGGQFEDLVPHLTIGQGATFSELVRAEKAVRSHGAVVGRALRLTLVTEGDDGRWSRLGFCTLGTDDGFQRF